MSGSAVMPAGAVGDVNSTERGSGARYNAGKPPLHLIPVRIIAEAYLRPARNRTEDSWRAAQALAALGEWQETGGRAALQKALAFLGMPMVWHDCAAAFDYGRKKYAEWNWAKGMAWSIPLACAARHLLAIIEGLHEDNLDPESKVHHRGHAACNIVMLLQFMESFPEGDDRPRNLAPVTA